VLSTEALAVLKRKNVALVNSLILSQEDKPQCHSLEGIASNLLAFYLSDKFNKKAMLSQGNRAMPL